MVLLRFRAWVKEDKEMWPVHAVVFTYNIVWVEEPDDENPSGCLNFDDVIIMQSTGIKDKNGKEIFEGDVVYDGFRKIIVNYGKQTKEEEFGAISEYVGFNITLACGYPEAIPMNYEIIGNIYENPELLK